MGSDNSQINPFLKSSSWFKVSFLKNPQKGNSFNLAAFRSPGLLGPHGFNFGNNFGYKDDSHDINTGSSINLSQGFRNKKSPDNLYLGDSISPNRDGNLNEFCYQNIEQEQNYNNSSKTDENCENSPQHRSSLNSNSPELINRTSPVESSRSYLSQKSDELDYNSPNNESGVESQSPENLTNNKRILEYPHNSSPRLLTEMLEHKFPISFLGQPLAALHSMTEMKSSGNNNISQTSSHPGSQAPNPHGIDTILSRPPPVTSAGLQALTSGKLLFFFSVMCF